MNAKSPRIIVSCLLLLASGLVASCSTEPAVQDEKVLAEQAQELPKPLEDIVIASEDDVPNWNESADKKESPSEKTDSEK